MVAEDMRQRVEDLKIPHKGSPFLVVTISLGIKAMRPGSKDTAEAFLGAADRALYKGKEQGRNRVVMDAS